MANTNSLTEKVLPLVNKFSSSKAIGALKDGILMVMPLSLIGSIFLLLIFLPFDAWNTWMTSAFGANWREPLFQVAGGTFDIMALVALFAITYTYVHREGYNGVSAGILSLVSYFIVTPSAMVTQKGELVTQVLSKNWSGGQGMIAAIVIGLSVGYIYTWFMKHNLTIKMPDSVPPGVANAFTTLIPGIAIAFLSMGVYILFKVMTGKSFIEWIYKVLQIPLQGLTDSLGGAIVIALLISLLWWFGIHGIAVVMGVIQPLTMANSLANQKLLDAGAAGITVSNGAHIVTQQFVDQFIILGGSGMTLGLVISMLLFAKSAQVKQLSKLAIIPGLFNINEPIVFGFPIVFNPLMLIPFIAVPVVSAITTYCAILVGFLKPFSAVTLPWSTPSIFSGFIVAGWKGAVLQVILILISIAIYLPFMKIQDKVYQQEEIKKSVQHTKAKDTGKINFTS